MCGRVFFEYTMDLFLGGEHVVLVRANGWIVPGFPTRRRISAQLANLISRTDAANVNLVPPIPGRKLGQHD